jgi:hypothetical protein
VHVSDCTTEEKQPHPLRPSSQQRLSVESNHRQSKIAHLCGAVQIQQHVLWLEIEVNQVCGVNVDLATKSEDEEQQIPSLLNSPFP